MLSFTPSTVCEGSGWSIIICYPSYRLGEVSSWSIIICYPSHRLGEWSGWSIIIICYPSHRLGEGSGWSIIICYPSHRLGEGSGWSIIICYPSHRLGEVSGWSPPCWQSRCRSGPRTWRPRRSCSASCFLSNHFDIFRNPSVLFLYYLLVAQLSINIFASFFLNAEQILYVLNGVYKFKTSQCLKGPFRTEKCTILVVFILSTSTRIQIFQVLEP